jgi:hypothetical protein
VSGTSTNPLRLLPHRRGERRALRIAPSAGVLLAYLAISFAYFGWRLLPHPGRYLVGHDQQSDAEIFIWSFAWWPHAILSWTNPFVSHVVYAPTGINLAWVTSVPGLALAFAPITLLFGPSVSFNLAALVLPALSAWTAYLLCRYLTRSTWASLVGGYLYGFSSYMLGHELASHLNLAAAFLVPLVALVVLRHVRGELGARGLAWRLGLLLAFQVYVSTEVTVTLTIALAVGLVLAFALDRRSRGRIRASLLPIAAGYGLAGVLAAPLLYYALTGLAEGKVDFASLYSADLLNLVVPTRTVAWGGKTFLQTSAHFPGNDAERDSYVGVPALLIAGLLVLRRPRAFATRFLLASFVLATVLSLGTALYVDSKRIVSLPWSVPARWTILESVIPSRIALYGALALAAAVAVWTATTEGRVFRRPYVLPVLAVAALVPPVWSGYDVERPQRWGFFSDSLYKVCIPRGETLMIFPFGHFAGSLLWQAESGFWFNIAEGTLAHNDQPASFASDPAIHALIFDPDNPPSMDELRALAVRRHVDRILSVAFNSTYPNGHQLHDIGPLQLLGGILVAPACGYDSLAGDKRPPPRG